MAFHICKAGDRDYFNYGWLKTYHTFLFRNNDSSYKGFRSLQAANENYIRPGTGFPVQSHQDLEIFSIVIEGGISHQDDLGNGSILRPGQIQLLSTGKGVVHSTYNASDNEVAHFWQFWLVPAARKLKPAYQEKFFSPTLQHNQFCLIISTDGRLGSLSIHQDVNIYLATLDQGTALCYELSANRYVWIQLMKGEIKINDIILEAGDSLAISEVSSLKLKAQTFSQLILFDLN